LLSAEQPDQPAAEIKGHLAQCPACRAWQRRLVQIERHIPLMPVPPSTTKDEFLGRILGTPPSEAPQPAVVERPPIAERPPVWRSSLASGPKERGRQKLSLAFSLAATLLVFALVWWAWPHPTPPQSVAVHPTQQQLDQKKLEERLARVLHVETAQERLVKLADLAEEVHGEARKMMDNAERLDQWARFYVRVVSENLMEEAGRLPRADRPGLLEKIANRLKETESNATRLATTLKVRAPKSAASFDHIAFAARKGQQDLRELMRV
jgi:hypothetical protein